MADEERGSGFRPYGVTIAGGAGQSPAPPPLPKMDITQPLADVAAREVRAVTSEKTIKANADRISAFATGIQEGKRMSLLGKMQHLTEDAEAFTKETSDVLDSISDKIKSAREKSAEAKKKHHDYYDGIIAGVNESIKVIDRLSNGPLPEDGKA